MDAQKLKIGTWSALVLAMVIFGAGRLVVNTRNAVAESTLTATAEAAADTWYGHYVVHMGGFPGLVVQNALETVDVASRHDADEFGSIILYRIYDRHGRLVLVSEPHRSPVDAPKPPPPSDQDQGRIRAVIDSNMPETEINAGWRRGDASLYFARSLLPIVQNGETQGVAEVFIDISSDRATIHRAFHQFSLILVLILFLASLIPFSAILYAWYRVSVLNRDLRQAHDKARHAEEVKSRFLANMSHEIRTPLNGIIGMAELLNDTEMTTEQRGFTATILNSSSALLTIINDVLDFSKIEAGKVTIQQSPFDLHNCVQDAATLLFPAGNGKGVELCVDFQKPLPAWVVGDEARLRQCLLNVVGNAVKFTETGHVTVRVSDREDDRIEIAVSDTGIGIPEDKAEAIFRDFEQADSGDSRSREGTGLGLAITRRLLRLMGGDITVESMPGKGSVFHMILPLPATAPPETARTSVPVLFLDPGALRGKRAVVVDDLEINRRILAARLASFGIRSTAFDSAAAVLSALRDGAQPMPDIVVSDHHMPGMDGADLLQALRALPGAADLPFVILTSGDLDVLRHALRRTDIEKCLSKPVRTDLLFKTLCSALQIGSGMPEAAARPRQSDPLPGVAPLRVCLAEDNKTNQLIVRKMIGDQVARFTVWNNGQEAVDNYLRERPELILMDISMPVKGGLTAATEIRALERKAGMPPCIIVALTAHALAEDRGRSEAAGMDGFLSKPIRKAELIEALAAAAERLASRRRDSAAARGAG